MLAGDGRQLRGADVPAVHPLAVGEDQLHLLHERPQRGGVCLGGLGNPWQDRLVQS